MEDRYKNQAEWEAGNKAARAILGKAEEEGRSLTSVEKAKVDLHVSKSEAFNTRKRVESLGGRATAGSSEDGWKAVAEKLAKGERKFEVQLGDVLRGKAVSDAHSAFETATTQIEGGIMALPLDERYIYSLFPQRDGNGILHVSDFRQSSRALD